MKRNEYTSKQTLHVFDLLGFEVIDTPVDVIVYLFHRNIPDEIIVDKISLISNTIINKQLENVGIPDWIFDSLYENLKQQ